MDFFIDEEGEDPQRVKTLVINDKNASHIAEDKINLILDLFDQTKKKLDAQETVEEEILNKLRDIKIENMYNDFFDEMKWNHRFVLSKKKPKLFHFEQFDTETGKLKSKLSDVNVNKEMEKSVLKTGTELPKQFGTRKLKRIRKKERAMTKGPEWFNMPAPEITEELKNDLQVLKMRSALDPKHFYKKNDMEVLPKYFQVGRIMDSPLDHVNEKLTKKQRKRTMVDELLADAEFQKYNKKKFKDIIEEKKKTEYRTFMKTKRQKNKAEVKKNKLQKKPQT